MNNAALRLALAGTLAILLVWSASHLIMWAQIGNINYTAMRLVQSVTPRNQFGHRLDAYRWYLDDNDTYQPKDDSYMDKGMK